ncbi:MAG: tetratricopeptide repeat protein [Myxococcales bacterium]|nr:tetratricopeptide repeat protein [Myxococcales bacterium]
MKRAVTSMVLITLAACTAPRAQSPDDRARERAPGEEHTAAERKAYEDGLELFQSAARAGFDEDHCQRLDEHFSALEGGEAAYMVGLSAQRCGDQEAALVGYREALKRQPALCAARLQLGLRDARAGRGAKARQQFETAVARDPRCAEGYLNLAVLQRKAGQAVEATRNVRRALAIEARMLPAFNELALLYLARAEENDKTLDLAEVVCSQAQKIDRDFAPIYNTWGLIDLRRGDITGAAAKFRQALTLDPKMHAAHMNYGRIALSYRAYDDAHGAFERALSLRPGSFDALVGLAVALRGLGKLDAAEARYAEARAKDGARPEPDFNLGVLYQDFRQSSREDLLRAREHFQAFLQKAEGKAPYADAVADVTRRCKPRTGARRGRARCMVGRLQNIEQYLEALAMPQE